MPAELKWEPLFSMRFVVARERAQRIGATSAGFRGVFPVDGGTFEGPRLRGVVNPDGCDWVTIRPDKSMLIDVRLTLRTDDDALIGMTYTGIARTQNPDDWDRFMGVEAFPDEDVYLRTTPRFETSATRYAWLNGLITVASGNRTEDGGRYDVFSIL